MRSLRLLVAILTIAAVAACTSAKPGWTYAPAPSATPIPSASGSVEPSASASAGPSAPASAAPSAPAPSGSPAASNGAGSVAIAATNLAFDPTEVQVPANQPFGIVFANNDAGIQHNVEIKDGAGTSVFRGEVFNGVETRTYDVGPLAPGAYPFICTVHPTMTGTLTAG